MAIENIENDQLKRMMAEEPSLCVLDVRTPEEYLYLGHIPGATLFPLQELPLRHKELDAKAKTVVLCQHGVRSMDAAYYLHQLGFENIFNLTQGMANWDGAMETGLPQPTEDATAS